MSEDDISEAELQLLIIMSKAYVEGYPFGEFRKEATKRNAEKVAQHVRKVTSHVRSEDEMDADYVFHQRVELLSVMAKAFAEGYPMGDFRLEALKENLDYVCEGVTFDSQAYDLKFLRVA